MKKLLVMSAALFLTLGLPATQVSAQGVLGKRTMELSFGHLLPSDSDLSKTDDTIVQLEAKINYPVIRNLDVFAEIGFSQLKGNFVGDFRDVTVEKRRIEAGVAYQFFPGEQVNPFVQGSAGYVSRKTDNPAGDEDIADGGTGIGVENEIAKKSETEGDFAFSFTGGVEFPFGGQFSASPTFTYRQVGDADDFIGGVGATGWFNQIIFAGVNVAYAFDAKDFSYAGTLGFGF